jgi:hypothetical protein
LNEEDAANSMLGRAVGMLVREPAKTLEAFSFPAEPKWCSPADAILMGCLDGSIAIDNATGRLVQARPPVKPAARRFFVQTFATLVESEPEKSPDLRAFFAAVRLIDMGKINRMLVCMHCHKWYFATQATMRFCPGGACQQAYWQVKAHRNQRMREYRELLKKHANVKQGENGKRVLLPSKGLKPKPRRKR